MTHTIRLTGAPRNARSGLWSFIPIFASAAVGGCSSRDFAGPLGPDEPSATVSSVIDGARLSLNLLEKARSQVQGCAFYGVSRNGVAAGISLPLSLLPFDLPAVTPQAGSFPARNVRIRISLGETGAGFAVSCIVPKTMTDEQFRTAVEGSAASVRWGYVVRHLHEATAPKKPSLEIREARFEIIGMIGNANVNSIVYPSEKSRKLNSQKSTQFSWHGVFQPPIEKSTSFSSADGLPPTIISVPVPEMQTVTVWMNETPDWWLLWPGINLADFAYQDFGLVYGHDPNDADPYAAYADTCHTGDPIVDAPAVQAALKSIWDQSNAKARDQSQRLELGGWITQASDGTIGFEQFAATSLPCGINVPKASMPASTIAWVHTHPWSSGEPQLMCDWQELVINNVSLGRFPINYSGESSSFDDTAAAELGKPGYLIDKDGIGKFDGSGVTNTRYGRCAY